MVYRTKTYIAGDWTGDAAAIEQLHKWNESNYWSLSFTDAHDFIQARDSSLNCNIKRSLKQRLDMSKTFVLIMGNKTDSVTAGSCRYCPEYKSWLSSCDRSGTIDYRSFIKYECDKAVAAGIKIVVLYNSTTVFRSKCPEAIRYKGTHVAMKSGTYSEWQWDYSAVKKAIIG